MKTLYKEFNANKQLKLWPRFGENKRRLWEPPTVKMHKKLDIIFLMMSTPWSTYELDVCLKVSFKWNTNLKIDNYDQFLNGYSQPRSVSSLMCRLHSAIFLNFRAFRTESVENSICFEIKQPLLNSPYSKPNYLSALQWLIDTILNSPSYWNWSIKVS